MKNTNLIFLIIFSATAPRAPPVVVRPPLVVVPSHAAPRTLLVSPAAPVPRVPVPLPLQALVHVLVVLLQHGGAHRRQKVRVGHHLHQRGGLLRLDQVARSCDVIITNWSFFLN